MVYLKGEDYFISVALENGATISMSSLLTIVQALGWRAFHGFSNLILITLWGGHFRDPQSADAKTKV